MLSPAFASTPSHSSLTPGLTMTPGLSSHGINCLFCHNTIRFNGVKSTQAYRDHLFNEHSVLFDADLVVEWTIRRPNMSQQTQHSTGQTTRPMLDAYVQVDSLNVKPLDLLPQRSILEEWEESQNKTIDAESSTAPSQTNELEICPVIDNSNVAKKDKVEVSPDSSMMPVTEQQDVEVLEISSSAENNRAKEPASNITVDKEPEVVEIDDDDEEDDFTDEAMDVDDPESDGNDEQGVKTKVLELPWYSGCEYQCRECDLIYFRVEDLRKHVSTHCPPDEYLERHKIFETKAEYFKCEICDKDIKRSLPSCRKHLKEYHTMSLKGYEKKFGLKANQKSIEERLLDPKLDLDGSVLVQVPSKVSSRAPSKNKKLQDMLCSKTVVIKLTKVDDQFKDLRNDLRNGWYDNNNANDVTVAEKKSTGPEIKDKKKYSKQDSSLFDWSNQCTFECKICDTTFKTYQQVWKHMKAKHKLAVTGYTKKFGSVTQEKRLHTCALCSRNIVHTSWHLSKHFRQNHDMELKTYFETYIATKTAGGLSSENDKTHRCAICSCDFDSLATFCEHLDQKHKVPDYDRYVSCYGDSVIDTPVVSKDKVGGKTVEETYEVESDARDNANTSFPTDEQSEAVEPDSVSERHQGRPQKYQLKWNHYVTFCPSCPATFYSWNTMRAHLAKKKIKSFHAIHGPVNFHLCHVCDKRIKCTLAHVKYHLKVKHSMTLPEYESKFYDSLKEELSKTEARTRAAVHPGYDANFGNKRGKVQKRPRVVKPKLQKTSQPCLEGDSKIAWNQQVFFCSSCPARFYNRTQINKHLSKKNLDRSQAIPGPSHMHRCHICHNMVKCDHGNIKYHLKAKHSMKMSEYERKFKDLLEEELSKVRAEYSALAHPGYNPDFAQGNPEATLAATSGEAEATPAGNLTPEQLIDNFLQGEIGTTVTANLEQLIHPELVNNPAFLPEASEAPITGNAMAEQLIIYDQPGVAEANQMDPLFVDVGTM